MSVYTKQIPYLSNEQRKTRTTGAHTGREKARLIKGDLSITTALANPSLKVGLKCSFTPVDSAFAPNLPRPGFARYVMLRSLKIKKSRRKKTGGQ